MGLFNIPEDPTLVFLSCFFMVKYGTMKANLYLISLGILRKSNV